MTVACANSSPLLILNVYLLTDYSDEDSAASYICAKICTCYSESDCVQVVIIGDFNCQSFFTGDDYSE